MRYKALPTKGNVDPEMALFQGAYALDAAAEVAEKTNDVEGLLNAAAMWLRFSQAMDQFASGVVDPETAEKIGDMVKSGSAKFEVGFTRNVQEIVADEEEEIDD